MGVGLLDVFGPCRVLGMRFVDHDHVCIRPPTPRQGLATGDLEDIRPNETVDLRREAGRFVIVESDRAYRFTIDGQRFDWPCRIVSEGLLRKLGQVPADKVIYFERQDQPDRQLYILLLFQQTF